MSPPNYTYAIARAFDAARVDGLRGIDGAPVHFVRYRDLVAAVSPLRAKDADETALRARLEKLPELEAIARSHHAVVEAIAACSVTLPLRLATIYRRDDRVAETLRRGYRRFREVLERLAGRVELGVKVYVNLAAVPTCPRQAVAASGSASPGKDYLRHRRRQRDQREDLWRLAATAARQLDARLTALAVDRREHRTQSPQMSAAEGENIFNLAYLVEAGRAGEFAEQARSHRITSEVSVEVTGPWAPYSFTVDDHDDERERTSA